MREVLDQNSNSCAACRTCRHATTIAIPHMHHPTPMSNARACVRLGQSHTQGDSRLVSNNRSTRGKDGAPWRPLAGCVGTTQNSRLRSLRTEPEQNRTIYWLSYNTTLETNKPAATEGMEHKGWNTGNPCTSTHTPNYQPHESNNQHKQAQTWPQHGIFLPFPLSFQKEDKKKESCATSERDEVGVPRVP